MRIALAGNPNSGKTTMFNALTGKNEKVGNWAGVTVEKKEHTVKKIYTNGKSITAADLPGAYSMSPFTSEESVTRDYISTENPDVIINIVDATNLSRSLFFTTQLLELGIPVVVALNKADINKKKDIKIDSALLSEKLGCPVVNTVSTSAKGLAEVVRAAMVQVGKKQTAPYKQAEIDLTDKAAVQAEDRNRFAFVNAIVNEVEKRSVLTREKNLTDKIDAVLTNKWLGVPVFAVVMALVFLLSQHEKGPGVQIADFLVGGIETFQGWVGGMFADANPLLTALLVDGIIGGVGAVVGFLPLVCVMYFLIALLEDCGYMARVSVVLDPVFKKVGLSGKSVIPFVIGTGCAIPGVMACRTIRDERERRATAMLAPFMPCGAKLPVISLFAGAFFEDASWVGTAMYFVGIVVILLGAVVVRRITGGHAKKSYFIIELPEYKLPSLKRAFLSMCRRGWSYIVKAATVILLCNTAVQIMQSFTWQFTVAESADTSILASVAGPFAYILVPVVGVLSWEFAAAAITGFIAKENVIATLAVCFVGLENLIDSEELSLMDGAAAEAAGVMAISKAAALAYLMFNLFSPPCFAAIGAMRSELKSAKWLASGIALQLGMGFTFGFAVYQAGTFITEGRVGNGFVPGLIAVLAMVGAVVALCIRGDRKAKVHNAKTAVATK
ncbi:MAG: ferrous iron transport protein B [Clostridia bacterium]|nr:ferrous iron transport protein B [Clostridia bacterium]